MRKLFFILILFSTSVLYSQSPSFRSYPFLQDQAKGLTKAIVTDELGYVWVATDNGAIRFDGKNAQFFKSEIPGGYLKTFCKRKDGTLLVLHDSGLTAIENSPDTVIFRPVLIGQEKDTDTHLHYPKTIFEDSQQRIWIGENQSVVQWANGQFKKYRFDSNQQIGVLFRSYNWAETPNGQLFVVSTNGQLYLFDEKKQAFIAKEINLQLNEVSSLIAISDKKLWVGAADGLFEIILNDATEVENIRLLPSPRDVSCAVMTGENQCYLGTWRQGLYYLTGTIENPDFQRINNLEFEQVIGLFYDKTNGLWLNTTEEITLLKKSLIQPFPLFKENRPGVEALHLEEDGSIFVVLNSTRENQEKLLEIREENASFNIHSVSVHRGNILMDAHRTKQAIWLGDLDGKIYTFDEKTGIQLPLPNVKPSKHPISFILEDQENNVWIGGNTAHGIIRIEPNGQRTDYVMDSFRRYQAICETSDGQLFVGGTGRQSWLYKFDKTTNKFVNISPKLPLEKDVFIQVNDLLATGTGEMLVATTAGLFRYKFNEQMPVEEVVLDATKSLENFNALAISADGLLCVSGSSGLYIQKNEDTYLFDKFSGLPSNSLTNKCLDFDENEKLWIGTAGGLAVFKVKEIDFSPTPAPIITHLTANGQPKKWWQEDLSFEYQSGLEINYWAAAYPANQVEYQYELEKNGQVILKDLKEKRLFLPYLNHGNYRVSLQARQRGGHAWSIPTVLNFTVKRPWYLRFFPMLSAVFASILAIILIVRYYNNQLLKDKELLEKTVKERTQKIERQKDEIIENQQEIIRKNQEVRALKESQLQDKLRYKNKQLTTFTLNMLQKNEALKELRLKLMEGMRKNGKDSFTEYRKYLNLIDFSFRKDSEWDNFKLYFEEVYVGFFGNLLRTHPQLTTQDLRHCALIKLNLSISETAAILGISPDSVKTARFRLKQKMELDGDIGLTEYLMKT